MPRSELPLLLKDAATARDSEKEAPLATPAPPLGPAVIFVGMVLTAQLAFVNFHPTVSECQNTFAN